jgi:hypothetical protein
MRQYKPGLDIVIVKIFFFASTDDLYEVAHTLIMSQKKFQLVTLLRDAIFDNNEDVFFIDKRKQVM